MKRLRNFFFAHSFSVRLLLGFVALILVTTLSAGVPAYWLTRTQLERQAWSQVESAQSATRSLLMAEWNRLEGQLLLFAQRPTLHQLARQGEAERLASYLQAFQQQSDLDILLFCAPDRPPLAGTGIDHPEVCPPQEAGGFHRLDGRPVILAHQAVIDEADGRTLGTAAAGIWLDKPFLAALRTASGAEQSILDRGGLRLSSSFAPAGAAALSLERGALVWDGVTYYAAYAPLQDEAGGTALFSEVALPVDDLLATERRAFTILGTSTGLVAFLGSLLSVWFVRQVNAPLQKLTATAEKISHGDLMAAIPLFSHPAEVRTLAEALHRSQASMLQALQERSAESERLNTLLHSIVEGVVTYDAAGRVTFWSAGAHHLLGWPAEAALEAHVNDLFPLAEEGEASFLELAPAPGQKRQLGILSRSGRPLVLAITGSQLIPPGGDTPQVALVFRDVTEEEAARRLRSYFLANISHEFRTPLSTLSASVELLLDEEERFTLAEVRQLLRPTHVSLLSLQTLIDNLLESSSIEAGRFTLRRRLFHINEAISGAANIARPLLERRSQSLSLAEPPHLPQIYADPTRLTQVLTNLIINASKYSPIGQPIELLLEQRPDALWLGVADRGPGIPYQERSSLFRSFVRLSGDDREQYGVGLGLYVVKTVVEAHGGRVGISDRPGGGSLFWFELPLRPLEEAE